MILLWRNFSLSFHFKRNSDDLNLFVSIYWFHFKEILNLFVSICNDPWHNVPWVVAQSLPNISQIKITKSVLNKKVTGEIPEARSDKRKPSWTFLEHQSASISISKHQSAYQLASISISIIISQHKSASVSTNQHQSASISM